ncbi:hypothetical protein [Cellulomonas sp. S1-8]|uniref:hypothetical protein n=1 Tax=Cellulomonas sp. S1-8 TaxID=2904790 RepID=UPI0022432FB3|nr:hypothetical protein [Cellulomonas sp. S1-8]UZN03943.1 hypothetical protein OKX07_03090 [Cellulomonas sp. S1-8]
MPYTAAKPPLPETPDELRARIPGWGADLDTANRPQVPRERSDLPNGAHWELPERQPETYPRERSIEHEMLTPVFGTAQPPHGLSGAIRRYSYERFSEARAAHWLLLIAADRVDAAGAHLRSLATLRPDNPITETGVLSELRRHPVASRRGRTDVRHQLLDPLIVAGPWIVGGVAVLAAVRALRRRV